MDPTGSCAGSGPRNRSTGADRRPRGGRSVAAGELLSRISGPQDLRGLDADRLPQLCGEIRETIIETVRRNGGHLAPSLGVVELTVALHRVFESPHDRIIWDVGHQCYAHKLLTGRREAFAEIRREGGPSGFCRRDESPHDPFGAGHASTSISSALGIATARDRQGEDYRVVAVIGDGGLSGGLALEGLDRAGDCGRDLIVVLNDNNMSISPTVGAISRHLTEIITHPLFERAKRDIWELTEKVPPVTQPVRQMARRIEESLKGFLTPGLFFENLGFRYLGPIEGHDLRALERVLKKVRRMHGPILVHVLTQKGRGLPDAEDDPRKYHGVPPVRAESGKVETGNGRISYTEIFGEALCELAERDDRLVAVSAAMCDGTGLTTFARRFPDRFYDVGIAEGHAVTFAAGLAAEGLRPVVAVYSTFLQRAFDQLVHDVALQRLPVIFALDRAGLVGEDGATHHGALDLAYLSCIPHFVVCAPRNGAELRDLLRTAQDCARGPFAIRYPRAAIPDAERPGATPRRLEIGRWERLRAGSHVAVLAVGTMVAVAEAAAARLATRRIEVELVNARFVKPLDREMLGDLARRHTRIVTLEEGTVAGGFAAQIERALADRPAPEPRPVLRRLGLPDRFIPHATRNAQLARCELTPERIASRIAVFCDEGARAGGAVGRTADAAALSAMGASRLTREEG
ncbi:MAG: 1-deoxy-D-xylulose-5-phosphate synthase [Candidatus Eisenbacteria bacterium]|nr:1-deoxy-D-xylulose-5-phosphate synthase [Candidatus Eisenbacteria bacterium]